ALSFMQTILMAEDIVHMHHSLRQQTASAIVQQVSSAVVQQEASTVGCDLTCRRGSRMTSRLKTILSWYESADRRCRREIFGAVFLVAFGIWSVRSHSDFPAHDAEQAFLSGVEYAGP